MGPCVGCNVLIMAASLCIIHPGSPAKGATFFNGKLIFRLLTVEEVVASSLCMLSLLSCWCVSSHSGQTSSHLLTSRQPWSGPWGLVQTAVTHTNACPAQRAEESKLHLCLSISVLRPRALLSPTRAFSFRQRPENWKLSSPTEVFQAPLEVLKNQARQRHTRDVKTTGKISFSLTLFTDFL